MDAAEVAINEALTAARRTRNAALIKALTESRNSLRSAKKHAKVPPRSAATTRMSAKTEPAKKRQTKIKVKPRPKVLAVQPASVALALS
jgi:hypothetical protein